MVPAMEAGATRQREFLGRLGLLRPVPIEFEEISRPQYPAQWREVNVITIAYGHGIAVSPLSGHTEPPPLGPEPTVLLVGARCSGGP